MATKCMEAKRTTSYLMYYVYILTRAQRYVGLLTLLIKHEVADLRTTMC